MSLLSRFRRTPAEPWPSDRPVRFITSFNDVFYAASGRRCAETFREYNPSYQLWAYVESLDAHSESELQSLGVAVEHVAELPLLREFLAIARDVIPQEFGGEMFPGEGPRTGDIWFRKHMYRWFRKIVALDHASADQDDVLFWIDSDCYSKAPLPLPLIEEAFRGAGVLHMRGSRKVSEAGFVGYDLARPGVHELIDAMKDHYLSQEFRRYRRWDDCFVLDVCLKRPGAPRARDIAKRAVGHADVLPTTPFAPYLEHEKGLHSRKLGLVR
jgi:hypothetical protein